jgi:hypothetical protein
LIKDSFQKARLNSETLTVYQALQELVRQATSSKKTPPDPTTQPFLSDQTISNNENPNNTSEL